MNKSIISDSQGKKNEFDYEGNIVLSGVDYYIFSREEKEEIEIAIFQRENDGTFTNVDDIEFVKYIFEQFILQINLIN